MPIDYFAIHNPILSFAHFKIIIIINMFNIDIAYLNYPVVTRILIMETYVV